MTELLEFLLFSRRLAGWGFRTTRTSWAVTFTESAVFFVFFADVLGYAPNTSFANNIDVKAMIFKDFSGCLASIIGGQEDFFEFPCQLQACFVTL